MSVASEEVKRMRAITGLSQSQFAKRFGIPTRTLQKWECGQSEPKSYVLEMMKQILDGQISGEFDIGKENSVGS